jgi:hypothetical protein
MKKVFLSFAFRDEDRSLVTAAEQLLASHDLVAVTGKRLAGEALTPAVMQRIEECDALVALLTRRDLKASGKWTTHDWVRDELNHARTKGIRAVALLENEVEVSGAFAEHERIPLDRGNPLDAFLALSDTIGLWKREEGRRLKIRIMPDELATLAGFSGSNVKCRYRFTVSGTWTDWRETVQIPEPGGTFLWAGGVQEDFLIQVQLEDGGKHWISPAYPQYVSVELKSVGGSE